MIYSSEAKDTGEPEKQSKEIMLSLLANGTNEVETLLKPAIVAAFLRVVYASIRFCPVREYREIALSQITDMEIFRKVTML